MRSQSLSEKELLRYNDDETSSSSSRRRAFEVVSLVCARNKTCQMG